MLRGNHIRWQVGKPNRALNRSAMAKPKRTNELHRVTAVAVAARIERIQLCRSKKWRLLRRRGTLAGYTTNQMARNNRAPRSWEVFDNVNKATFPWDHLQRCQESFDRVCPRPARPRPCSSLGGSVPDLLTLGLSLKGAGRSRDAEKCASPWLRNY